MINFFLKFLVVLILTISIIFAFLSLEIFNAGQKIFVQNNKQTSILQQFGEMIFAPSEKLNGEENGRINILLLGVGGEEHNGGNLTDTIMIASIDPKENEAALLSVPRDLYVQIPNTNTNTKINAVKSFGDNNKKRDGVELLKQVIKEISGMNMDYYVELNFKGFMDIIDGLGGIDVYLDESINDPVYPDFENGYDPFYISKGHHHLDGATALKVARSRHSKMGDFDRIKRQQMIVKASKQKIYEKYSKLDITAFKDIVVSLGDNLRTDIQPKEIPRFYKIVKNIQNHKISAATIDTKNYLDRSYMDLGYTLSTKSGNYEEIKSLSANIFKVDLTEENKELIKKEGANIEIRNGTGTLDLANKVAGDLEELGYRIINSTNINSPDFNGVLIYDNSKNLKPITSKFLKEKFAAAIEVLPVSESTRADFVIILGKGF